MKKGFLVLFSLFILFLTPNIVSAASANVSISAPSSVYVGDTVTINVSLSSSSKIGAWEYFISYDDSVLSYSSTTAESAQHVINSSDSGRTSVNYSWTFKATSAGSASFSISGIDAYAFDDDSSISVSGSTSTTINVVKPSSGGSNGGSNGGSGNTPSNSYKYSDDNSLSSLVIEGFNIDFDSNVTEYSVSVPNDTKKVKIGATANDGNASVSGIGDYDVKEGDNEIKIVVTAENGDTRTYKVNVIVKELSPIDVKVNDKNYSVVRKSDKLPKANVTYKTSTILIKGESVPCYHSEITDIYLVGLMNDKGKIELFSYDSKNDKFIVYNEINIGGLYISLIENADAPIGYKSGLVKIGDKEYNGYLKDGSYSLLYGINLETGEKNFYSYDSSEGTLQKYVSSSKVNSKCYSYILFGLIGLCIFEFIMIIVCVVSKNKKLKKVLKQDINNEAQKAYNSDSLIESNISQEYSDNLNEQTDSINSDDMDYNDQSQVDEQDDIEDYASNESLSDSDLNVEDKSDVSFDTEEIEEGLGHTALISRSVTNVYNNTKNRKESIKERKSLRKKKKKNRDDDDMFKF